MPADVLAGLVRDAITDYLLDDFETRRAADANVRATIRDAVEGLT